MDDQYDNVNHADFDVIRSTQFQDNFPRGVRDISMLVLGMYNTDAHPSGNMALTRCLQLSDTGYALLN